MVQELWLMLITMPSPSNFARQIIPLVFHGVLPKPYSLY